eukprot:354895-Ditylum_brightwellii.AAC.1
MTGYILKILDKFQHPAPKFPQHCHHQWNRPVYGKKVQYVTARDNLPPLDAKGTKQIQTIVCTFLCYSRALEGPALPALNNIGTQPSALTKLTINDANWMMDFFHTYPNAKLWFFAGDMQLIVESNAAYLVMPGAKSRISGYFYLVANLNPLNYNKAPHNVPILGECLAIQNVVCTAAEAECGGLFHYAQIAVRIWNILQVLNHPQRATKIKTDNSTANAFVHALMKIKQSK